jgi:hypothetical protein
MAHQSVDVTSIQVSIAFRERQAWIWEVHGVCLGYLHVPSGREAVNITSVAKEVVAERFGPNKKVQLDMLGSFIAQGLTQEEAGSESLLQMLVP